MEDTFRLAGVIKESIVDGPGLRFVVFAQGCEHCCEGCHNSGTHAADGGYLASLLLILEEIKSNPLLQGVTFSGGEPFLQAGAFASLAEICKKEGLDIVVFTGYTFEELISGFAEHSDWERLLRLTDLLIDGKFILGKKSLSLRFRGSTNQRIIDVQKSLKENRICLSPIN